MDKEQRKNLLEHNLLYVLNKESNSNKSQTWRRIKDKSIRAINDLALLASKSSDDKLQEIFNEDTLKDLLYALFVFDHSESKLKLRSADILLASKFVEVGMRVCISEYEKWNKDTPETSQPTIEYLKKSIAIGNEIGFKSRMNIMEKEFPGKRKEFIGIWEELHIKNPQKFREFISKEMEISDPDRLEIVVEKNDRFEKEFYVNFSIGDPSYDDFVCKLILNINPVGNDGNMQFYNIKNERIKSKKIIIKRYASQTALFC